VVPKLGNASCAYAQLCVCAISRCIWVRHPQRCFPCIVWGRQGEAVGAQMERRSKTIGRGSSWCGAWHRCWLLGPTPALGSRRRSRCWRGGLLLSRFSAVLMPSSPHRFPAPWSAEVTPNYFIVRDADGQALNYIYYEKSLGGFNTSAMSRRRFATMVLAPSLKSKAAVGSLHCPPSRVVQ